MKGIINTTITEDLLLVNLVICILKWVIWKTRNYIKYNKSIYREVIIIINLKNERDPPLFIGTLLIKFQNILRNTTQVIIRHRVKILEIGTDVGYILVLAVILVFIF
jgi:hypothetical protein